jgi:hypothetical protein
MNDLGIFKDGTIKLSGSFSVTIKPEAGKDWIFHVYNFSSEIVFNSINRLRE